MPSSEVLDTTGGAAEKLCTELEKIDQSFVESASIEVKTVRQHMEIKDEAKQRHAKAVCVWKKVSKKEGDTLVNDVKVANVEPVKMAVEQKSIPVRIEMHMRALRTLVHPNSTTR